MHCSSRWLKSAAATVVALLPTLSHATGNVLPEPSAWTLVALAGVAAGVVTWRNRRK